MNGLILALAFLMPQDTVAVIQNSGTATQQVVAKAITSIPSGIIVFVQSGSCPSGFTEVGSGNGAYVLLTTSAAGDVGTTGGSNSVTAAGSVSAPSFSGNAAVLTGSVAPPVFSGTPAITSSVSAGVASGTNASVSIVPLGVVSQPTFNGNAVVAASTNTGPK